MRSVFICNKKNNIGKVYADTLPRLREVAALDGTVYSKDDVLAAPATFYDVEYIFSTWGMPTFTAEEIRSLFPSLKCVFYAAGSVQAFARPLLECGTRVFSAWAANGVPVAEYTLAQIVLSGKGFFRQSLEMKNGNYSLCRKLRDEFVGNYGERVGLIGVGMIGSMVAERLIPYDLEVLAFDPFLSDERAAALQVKTCDLPELFSTCRVISNHLANNADTVGMLNYNCFSRMLPYSTFINTGRGAQVVEDDLVRLLSERPDVTAILDVTYPEPPAEGHPFYSLTNCVLTPHIAGSLCNETHRMAEYMADEFCRFVGGERTLYEVTLTMLLTMA